MRIALTSSSPRFLSGAAVFDSRVSLMEAVRRLFGKVGGILYVGGETFGLIRFDAEGNYLGARGNSSCAAGTGSFLDQQARRLGLGSIQELARTALANTSEAPKISTRCAVFARTDLVHAQAAGYTMGEICDGLCRGLAQNIADTLLAGEPPHPPLVFAGGVAANEAVRRQLEKLFSVPVVSHALSPVMAACGAAFCALSGSALPCVNASETLAAALSGPASGDKQYFFDALPRDGTAAAGSAEGFVHDCGRFSRRHPVEVEIYRRPAPGGAADVFLGIDIGSTSTKAVLMDAGRRPLVGLYTRTSGAPMSATQALAEAAVEALKRTGCGARFLGTAATGAGRKFIGKIIGADATVDEITAHARAAYELDPETDTIIEIGGQDAKFTTMRGGMVTFSHLNTVCAAGTGSFLEEQAARLGVKLSEYSERVRGVRAPLASDRCAVFMERDINHYIGRGYSTEEILAAALFSVRENYLQKVARGAAMGRAVCFQGATARNAALVAAFEQGLGRRIKVSPYCHIAGAYGAALIAASRPPAVSAFRGLSALIGDEIPIRGETCSLCANHCRIRIADIAGETVAYGFLCGRDYDTARYVANNSSGFDLPREWRNAWTAPSGGDGGRVNASNRPAVGIPAALTLSETLPLWEKFFDLLSIPFITSRRLRDGVSMGKKEAGAEFCAPLTALHGHARWLLDQADFVFLPLTISEDRSARRCMYCYYTQFSAPLVSCIEGGKHRGRFLMPLVRLEEGRAETVGELFKCLRGAGFGGVGRAAVGRAFDGAVRHYREGLLRLERLFTGQMASRGPSDVSVLLIGRPYAVHSEEMAKGIPAIFGALGVKAFCQEMAPADPSIKAEMEALRAIFRWRYPLRLLSAALTAAKTPFLYPVFITSFKCSPDSFALEYFKRIMEAYGKPYLVLQLDDHDSSVGYETRIEAGVAAFRNHAASDGKPPDPPAFPVGRSHMPERGRKALAGKTLLIPNWDPLLARLLAANLRREGIDARALEEDPLRIRKAMRSNTGQCIPLNIVAEDFMDYVESNGLDPGRSVLWMADAGLACNINMFPSYLKAVMESRGGGFERSVVYRGDITHYEISIRAAMNAYQAHLLAGLLRRTVCRIRPYETEPGSTDRALAHSLDVLTAAFEGGTDMAAAVGDAVSRFEGIRTSGARRPKAAIFGDLYVRDNDVLNQDLVRAIEEAGGEAVTTPYTEYCRIVADSYFLKWRRKGEHVTRLRVKTLFNLMRMLAVDSLKSFEKLLGTQEAPLLTDTDAVLSRFGVRTENDGESFDNLLKIFHLSRTHPDLALFVQASPVFCCPGLVTEAMARDIQSVTGIPVVSLTYDGTGRLQNDAIVPYLAFPARRGTGA